MSRIMLVDDDRNVVNALRRTLNNPDYEIQVFTDPLGALAELAASAFDLIISDYRMPEMNGVEFLKQAKHSQPSAMRVILSATADLDVLTAAINDAEIFRFIAKPWDDYGLRSTVSLALTHGSLLEENRRLANQVRQQEAQLRSQVTELKRLEDENPGLTQVDWGPDGSIILNEDDYK